METYRKIYIKSEADLPKEKGRYAVGIKGTPFRPLYLNSQDFDPEVDYTKPFCNYGASTKYWMDSFDWYLQPVEQEKPSESAEEIQLLNEIIDNQHKLIVNAEKRGYDKAMEEYASQKHLPTDEEIENEIWEEITIPLSAKDIEDNSDNYKTYRLVVDWVKYFRDKSSK